MGKRALAAFCYSLQTSHSRQVAVELARRSLPQCQSPCSCAIPVLRPPARRVGLDGKLGRAGAACCSVLGQQPALGHHQETREENKHWETNHVSVRKWGLLNTEKLAAQG